MQVQTIQKKDIQIYTVWLIFAGQELDRDQAPLLNNLEEKFCI